MRRRTTTVMKTKPATTRSDEPSLPKKIHGHATTNGISATSTSAQTHRIMRTSQKQIHEFPNALPAFPCLSLQGIPGKRLQTVVSSHSTQRKTGKVRLLLRIRDCPKYSCLLLLKCPIFLTRCDFSSHESLSQKYSCFLLLRCPTFLKNDPGSW